MFSREWFLRQKCILIGDEIKISNEFHCIVNSSEIIAQPISMSREGVGNQELRTYWEGIPRRGR